MNTPNTPQAWVEEGSPHQDTMGDFSSPNATNATVPSKQPSDLDQVLNNPALLAIRIGTQKNLNMQQIQELQALTMFLAKFTQGPDLLLAVFNLASQLQVTQLINQLQSSFNNLSSDLKDIKGSLAGTPKLSSEQKQQIARACNAVTFNVNRRSFDNNNITKDAYVSE
ncbi:hypothetical protein K435DRAFT_865936 [Dendrothele bispora CBS 962.96]|uniref:Uncharacterized protein n=1 Tax=Dendrothele bispora (strain CBS 962.96) TaxID=1314807 RepID=A0A4S8LI77_DENBC|nr:hypothetical protein K435DRAFT_865936 [Dendrothele bispora CBS 962.96]